MIDFFHRHSAYADKASDLLIAALIAFLTWWLTNRSRDRSDREAEKVVLRAQADALIIATGDLRAAADAGRLLWDRPVEQLRTFFLAALIGAGRMASPTPAKGTDWPEIAAGIGEAAQFLGRERLAGKQFATTLREPVMRLTTAAAPLLRHPDATIATAAEELFAAATGDITNTARAQAALETFGRAVRVALEPRPNPLARLLRRLTRRDQHRS